MKSLGWALIQYDWYPYKKGKFGYRASNAQKEEDAKTHREKMAVYKPREAWNRSFPYVPWKEPTLLTP